MLYVIKQLIVRTNHLSESEFKTILTHWGYVFFPLSLFLDKLIIVFNKSIEKQGFGLTLLGCSLGTSTASAIKLHAYVVHRTETTLHCLGMWRWHLESWSTTVWMPSVLIGLTAVQIQINVKISTTYFWAKRPHMWHCLCSPDVVLCIPFTKLIVR